MTAERVTVSLPELLGDARSAVAAGAAESLPTRCAPSSPGPTHSPSLERVLGGPPPREVLDAVRRELGLART